MIPMLILYVTLNRRSFIIHVLISLGIIILVMGSLGIPMVLISLFFMGPVIVMGYLYKNNSTAHVVIAASVITFLAEMVFIFLITALFGMNLVQEITQFIRDSYDTVPEFIRVDIPREIIEQAINTMTQMIPLYMISFAVYYTMITHWIGRKLLNHAGYTLNSLPAVKEWMLPKSLVWHYAGALILSLFIEAEAGSMFTMILYNIVPILTFAFCVQAVSFLFFITDVKGWNRSIPIIGIVASLFLPSLISLLGLFDIMFELRKKFQKEK